MHDENYILTVYASLISNSLPNGIREPFIGRGNLMNESYTVCPRRSDPFSIVTSYYINWITTSWTYSMNSIQCVNDSVRK